jgi:hypothetical protein
MGLLSSPCRVALFSRQAIEIWFVTERTIICFGNHTVRYVGPVEGAVEPAKCVGHNATLPVAADFRNVSPKFTPA